MVSGYNLISPTPLVYPSIFNYTGVLPSGASAGDLVTINGNLNEVYSLRNAESIFFGSIDSKYWVENENQTYKITKITFNNTVYDLLTFEIYRRIEDSNYYSVTNWIATPSSYAAGNTYNNWVNFLNEVFNNLSLPIRAIMYENTTYGDNLIYMEFSEGDTFEIDLESNTPTEIDFTHKIVKTLSDVSYYRGDILEAYVSLINTVDSGFSAPKPLSWDNNNASGLGLAPSIALFPLSNEVFIEDGVVSVWSFWSETEKEAVINDIKLNLVAFNNITGENFLLDSYTIPISNTLISGGIQQFNIDTIRGFPLAEGSQFNYVKIEMGSLVGTKQYYTAKIALKFTWQTWIAVLDADTIFYDESKPNNNLNKKASNYSELNNYSVRIGLLTDVSGLNSIGADGQTDFNNLSTPIKVNDYDVPTTGTDWAIITKKTYDNESDTDLDGKVRSDAYTRIEYVFDNNGALVGDISNYYGIIRIEKTGQRGFVIHELSTLRESEVNNLLIPIEPLLQMEVEAPTTTTLKLQCLVDYTKLESGAQYNISATIREHLGLGESKITEVSEVKITESGDIKILE